MAHLGKRHIPLMLAAVMLAGWTTASYAEASPYSARYSVYRNGILSGKAELVLEHREDGWSLKSDGNGTHGLAKVLGASDQEEAVGTWLEGAYVPNEYTRQTRLAGILQLFSARFDWENGLVTVVQEEQEAQLELTPSAVDPLTLKIELRRRLSEDDPNLNFLMVDEDEIEEQQFRKLDSEWLETSLGCLETVPVERVRTNSTRYTRAWHAPGLQHVAVRMEHGKTDGDHMEMRITELVLAEGDVTPMPGCAARQQGVETGDEPGT